MKLSIAEAAEYLECTEARVLELLREGRLPGWKPGKSWIIPAAAFYNAVNDIADEEAKKLQAPAPQPSRGTLRGRPPLTRSVQPICKV